MGLDIPALRILRETIRIYQDCQTYTDQGRATVFSYDQHRSPRREMLFATAFRRPNRLRFDVRAVPPEPVALPKSEDAVVCWRGDDVETWLGDEPAPVESLTIESVLAEVTDLPTAAAGYIAHLLLCHPADFAQEHRVRYHGTRSIESGLCHKLTIPSGPPGPPRSEDRLGHGAPLEAHPEEASASRSFSSPGSAGGAGAGDHAPEAHNALTLWIDAESHLIRRLLEVHRTPNHGQPTRPTQTILRFDPRLDESVGDELFDYEPPPDPPLASRGAAGPPPA